jgi:hypothetical protein
MGQSKPYTNSSATERRERIQVLARELAEDILTIEPSNYKLARRIFLLAYPEMENVFNCVVIQRNGRSSLPRE